MSSNEALEGPYLMAYVALYAVTAKRLSKRENLSERGKRLEKLNTELEKLNAMEKAGNWEMGEVEKLKILKVLVDEVSEQLDKDKATERSKNSSA